jgi:catechol 2,3-dioxygenase-like lactoylglutathione lyase family enzyme
VATRVAHREPAVPIIKWPQPGMVLPIEVAARNPRQFRVRWDLVVPHHTRPTREAEEAAAFAAPFFTEYGPAAADDLTGVDEGLLDHHEHLPFTDFADHGDGYAGLDDDDYDDYGARAGEPAARGPATPTAEFDRLLPPAPGSEADPDTIDGEVIEQTLQLDPEPTETPKPTETPEPTDSELAPRLDGRRHRTNADGRRGPDEHPLVSRPIPQPRAADAETESPAESDGPAILTESGGEPGVGLMLFVSDLGRSLRFYRETLNFTVTHHNTSSAVLTYGGGRVVLRRVIDMSPVDRRVVHLHVDVPDVDAAYQELRSKGVEFVHRPRVMTRSDRLELWAATFRDPDGHAIALTQWRERAATP